MPFNYNIWSTNILLKKDTDFHRTQRFLAYADMELMTSPENLMLWIKN